MAVHKQPKRYHREHKRQIEGRNAVREALRAGSPVEMIYLEEQMNVDDRIREITDLARKAKIDVELKSPRKLRTFSKTSGHYQGVIAFVTPEEELELPFLYEQIMQRGDTPFFLILTDAVYEHNLGAVIRSAESAGAHAVIVPKKAPKLTAVVSRTAVGAGEYIPLIHVNLFTTIKFLRKKAITIFGAREGDNKSIYRCDFDKPLAILMGAEDAGISDPLAKHVDQLISIPMFGKIESLNMSVAAALCLYEVVRQRKYLK